MPFGADRVVILDNGGYSVKSCLAESSKSYIFPNCIFKAKGDRKRIFISEQIKECKNRSSLYYMLPLQKGFLVNWDVQRQVWDYIFGKDNFNIDCEDCNLIFTEPHFDFSSIQETLDEIFFEEYQFKAVLRTNASTMSAYKYASDHIDQIACLVVDSGYSFTHIVPYVNGIKIKEAMLRLAVGGKALTNYLKEIVSYRQLQVLDETYVINQCKEDACFVSSDLQADLKVTNEPGNKNIIVKEYVLPDFLSRHRGCLRKPVNRQLHPAVVDEEQCLRLNNERFLVPEVLFHPVDIGIQELGISEAILYSIDQMPDVIRPHLFNNIVLTGGSCAFSGFQTRVYDDVRAACPDECDVRVTLSPQDVVTYALQGGRLYANNPLFFDQLLVTRRQYNEVGHNICLKQFDI